MERRFYKELYCQSNKNETILSVVKRMFGEYILSRSVRMQNRELFFRVIAYNMHRLTVFLVWFLQSLLNRDYLFTKVGLFPCKDLRSGNEIILKRPNGVRDPFNLTIDSGVSVRYNIIRFD